MSEPRNVCPRCHALIPVELGTVTFCPSCGARQTVDAPKRKRSFKHWLIGFTIVAVVVAAGDWIRRRIEAEADKPTTTGPAAAASQPGRTSPPADLTPLAANNPQLLRSHRTIISLVLPQGG